MLYAVRNIAYFRVKGQNKAEHKTCYETYILNYLSPKIKFG